MKSFLIFAWVLLSVFLIHAAPTGNPGFADFNTNQFSITGRKVSLFPGLIGTNGLTYFFPSTNLLGGQLLTVNVLSSNTFEVLGTNVMAPSVVVDTIEQLVATAIPAPGISLVGFVRDSRGGLPLVYKPTSTDTTNRFRVYPTTSSGRWHRTDDPNIVRPEWGTVTGFAVTNDTLIAALALQSAQGTGAIILSGNVTFLETSPVPLLDNNLIVFADGAQATGLKMTATSKTNISIVGANFKAPVADPSLPALALTNCNHVAVQSAAVVGYSSVPFALSGNTDAHFFDSVMRENTPQAYGAVADGVTDDYIPAQMALDVSAASLARIPAQFTDVYATGSGLSATNTVRIIGTGTLKELTPLNFMLLLNSAHNTHIEGVSFSGVDTTNNWPVAAVFTRRAITITSSTNVTIDRVIIAGKNNGIWADFGSHALTVKDSSLTGIFGLPERAWMNGHATFGTYYLFGGIIFTDSDATLSDNKIHGYGQGIAGRVSGGPYPCAILQGNRIQKTADNGVYLVQSRESVVSGNVVEGAGGSGLKLHGGGGFISKNTIKNAGVGVSLYGIGTTPTVGSWDHTASLALESHIFDGTNVVWFNGSGSEVNDNTITDSGRHGILFGETSDSDPSTNKIFLHKCIAANNTVRGFAQDGTGPAMGIQVYGQGHTITGNNISEPFTNGCFGILIGPSIYNDAFIGFGQHNIQGNTYTSTNATDTGIYAYHIRDSTIAGNILKMAANTGIFLEGCREMLISGNHGLNGTERIKVGNALTASSVCTNIVSSGNYMPTFEALPSIGLSVSEFDTTNNAVMVSRLGSTATAAFPSANYNWILSNVTNTNWGLKIYNFTDDTQSDAEILFQTGSDYTYLGNYGAGYTVVPARARRFVFENGGLGYYFKHATAGGTFDFVYDGSSTPLHVIAKTNTHFTSVIESKSGGFKFPDGSVQTTAAGGGLAYDTVQEEGTPVTARRILNFIGAGVTAVDNAGTLATDVTITSGGATINATDGLMPYRVNSTTFADSPITRVSSTDVTLAAGGGFQFGANHLRSNGDILQLTNSTGSTPKLNILSKPNNVLTSLYSDDSGGASALTSSGVFFLISGTTGLALDADSFEPAANDIVDLGALNSPFESLFLNNTMQVRRGSSVNNQTLKVYSSVTNTFNIVPEITGSASGDISLNLQSIGTGTVQVNGVPIGAGTGDVVGPASAVENTFARYSGTTGKLIKESTFADSGTAITSESTFLIPSASITNNLFVGGDIQTLGDIDASLGNVDALTITLNSGTPILGVLSATATPV